jgi:hypothetical protein
MIAAAETEKIKLERRFSAKDGSVAEKHNKIPLTVFKMSA